MKVSVVNLGLTSSQEKILDSCPVSTLDANLQDLDLLEKLGLIRKISHKRGAYAFYAKVVDLRWYWDLWSDVVKKANMRQNVVDEEGRRHYRRWNQANGTYTKRRSN